MPCCQLPYVCLTQACPLQVVGQAQVKVVGRGRGLVLEWASGLAAFPVTILMGNIFPPTPSSVLVDRASLLQHLFAVDYLLVVANTMLCYGK
jgi:hypothetical protein